MSVNDDKKKPEDEPGIKFGPDDPHRMAARQRYKQLHHTSYAWHIVVAVAVVAVAGVMWVSLRGNGVDKPGAEAPARAISGNTMKVTITYPSAGALMDEEREVPAESKDYRVAAVVAAEFLRGAKGSVIPPGAALRGVFLGVDHILYVDLSQDTQRNFQGQGMAEFMMLKALHETLTRNVPGIKDVKVLIEGREADSLGGHFSLMYPLSALAAFNPGQGDAP